MAYSYPKASASNHSPTDSRRSSGSSARLDGPYIAEQELHRTGQGSPWIPPGSNLIFDRSAAYQPARNADPWARQQRGNSQDYSTSAAWKMAGMQSPASSFHHPSVAAPNPRHSLSTWSNSMPGPMLRRISSEDVPLSELHHAYGGSDMSSSVPNLQTKAFSQRRPSNRDEFDGPAQFLNKPIEGMFEPSENDMPSLPVSLYAQEQDEILSQVNDRLSKCAFDFVAKYQFPIPIEADKRQVRVAHDREWQEWVYLLKRLATKRRIPSRVLYNGQIKQFITILENSIEMRHAAKHQSRPLKDDRNVLQLISSGIQVAKILKDAPAMQFLDELYTQTERRIQSRRVASSSAMTRVSRA